MKIRAIITGASGMLGGGTLLECLDSDQVESVLVVNRSSIGMTHPKLKEVLHSDFLDIAAIRSEFEGYNACFFCMGVSSAGMNEEDYTRLTYDLVSHWAEVLHEVNPDMVFNYISGQGTDSSEQGRTMWARVKGKTENMLLGKGFRDAYAFRPGAIIPKRGVTARAKWVRIILTIFRPFFPLFGLSKSVTTTIKVGRAMINVVLHPQEKKHLTGADINRIAELQ